MAYKLLALDMDGTVLNSQKKISQATVSAVAELLNRGVNVVLSTGRGLAEISDYRDELKLMSYGILISGGMVYDFRNDKPLILHPVPEDAMMTLIDSGEIERAMIHLLTVNDSIARAEDIAEMASFEMGIYQGMYERICTHCNDFRRYIREHPGEVIKVNIYHRSPESRAKSIERVKHLGLTLAIAETTALEASPKDITKASGLRELCEFLNIDIADTVAVGDAFNDIEILQAAGLSVAMGNAIDEVKQLADFVTDDNDHDGVVTVIKKFFA